MFKKQKTKSSDPDPTRRAPASPQRELCLRGNVSLNRGVFPRRFRALQSGGAVGSGWEPRARRQVTVDVRFGAMERHPAGLCAQDEAEDAQLRKRLRSMGVGGPEERTKGAGAAQAFPPPHQQTPESVLAGVEAFKTPPAPLPLALADPAKERRK